MFYTAFILIVILSTVQCWPYLPLICEDRDSKVDCLDSCECMWWSKNASVSLSESVNSSSSGVCTGLKRKYIHDSNNPVFKNGTAFTSYFSRTCTKNRDQFDKFFTVMMWIFGVILVLYTALVVGCCIKNRGCCFARYFARYFARCCSTECFTRHKRRRGYENIEDSGIYSIL